MEKEFVSYDLALELKELGFDEPCFGFYVNNKVKYGIASVDKNINKCWADELFCTAPTFSQAFRFFREQLLLDSCIIPYWFIDGEYKVKKYTYSIEPSNRFDEYFDCDSDEYDTYKDAELECLVKLIEIVKEQNVK